MKRNPPLDILRQWARAKFAVNTRKITHPTTHLPVGQVSLQQLPYHYSGRHVRGALCSNQLVSIFALLCMVPTLLYGCLLERVGRRGHISLVRASFHYGIFAAVSRRRDHVALGHGWLRSSNTSLKGDSETQSDGGTQTVETFRRWRNLKSLESVTIRGLSHQTYVELYT